MINRNQVSEVIVALTSDIEDVLTKMILQNIQNIINNPEELNEEQIKLARYIEQHPEMLVAQILFNEDSDNPILAMKYAKQAQIEQDQKIWY